MPKGTKGQFTPIAIVGYGCVFPPDALDSEAYWRNLVAGVSGIDRPTADRWSWELYFDPDRGVPEKTYCRLGGFVSGYEFRSARMAAEHGVDATNRSQRFALDVCGQALARTRRGRNELTEANSMLIMANMLGDELWGEASLNYRKTEILSYIERSPAFASLSEARRSEIREKFLAGVDARFPSLDETPSDLLLPTALPRVVAKALGVTGPSFLVDGACAGGLLVVDAAVRQLHDHRADVVVAVAVMANMAVTGNVAFAKIGGLSPDKSRPLDTSANGLIPSEGAGAVILKRLDDALAAGDNVLAVIRGVASRTDGKGKAIYAPSSRGQVAAMRRALDLAGWTLGDVDHVETHATATAAGDKVELASLKVVAGAAERAPEPGSISVGSVKALIGHAFPAAGMANLIKILTSMEHGEIAPTHHVTAPQPQLTDPNGPFAVHGEPRPWPAGKRRRRALANAFGFGGVNASICVEDFDPDFHGALNDQLGSITSPAGRSGRAAIVGVAAWTAHTTDLAGLADAQDGAPGGYPGGRGHSRAAEIYDPRGERRAHAIDFEFPWREYRIPPDTLASIDRAQQLALVVAGLALKDAGRPTVPETAVAVGACAGLEATTSRNLLIRAVEYEAILRDVLADADDGRFTAAEAASAIRAELGTYISPTTESALPGYMDNIVPGRLGNMFDLRGANIAVDAGRASFPAALDLGLRALHRGECDELLVGGVSANLSDEMILAMASAGDGDPTGVPAEAAAFFLLKPVEELTASDRVYAVIDGVDVVREPESTVSKPGEADYYGAIGAIRLAAALATHRRASLDHELAPSVPVPFNATTSYQIRLSASAVPEGASRGGGEPASMTTNARRAAVTATVGSAGSRGSAAEPAATLSRGGGSGTLEGPGAFDRPGGQHMPAYQYRMWRGLTNRQVGDLLTEIAGGGAPPERGGGDGGTWNIGLAWRSREELTEKAKAALVALRS